MVAGLVDEFDRPLTRAIEDPADLAVETHTRRGGRHACREPVQYEQSWI